MVVVIIQFIVIIMIIDEQSDYFLEFHLVTAPTFINPKICN